MWRGLAIGPGARPTVATRVCLCSQLFLTSAGTATAFASYTGSGSGGSVSGVVACSRCWVGSAARGQRSRGAADAGRLVSLAMPAFSHEADPGTALAAAPLRCPDGRCPMAAYFAPMKKKRARDNK